MPRGSGFVSGGNTSCAAASSLACPSVHCRRKGFEHGPYGLRHDRPSAPNPLLMPPLRARTLEPARTDRCQAVLGAVIQPGRTGQIARRNSRSKTIECSHGLSETGPCTATVVETLVSVPRKRASPPSGREDGFSPRRAFHIRERRPASPGHSDIVLRDGSTTAGRHKRNERATSRRRAAQIQATSSPSDDLVGRKTQNGRYDRERDTTRGHTLPRLPRDPGDRPISEPHERSPVVRWATNRRKGPHLPNRPDREGVGRNEKPENCMRVLTIRVGGRTVYVLLRRPR